MSLKSFHVRFFALVILLAVGSFGLLFFTPTVLAYEGNCPVTDVTTGSKPDEQGEDHHYIELTIPVEERYVQLNSDGTGAHSNIWWIPTFIVNTWKVEPPSAGDIPDNHWRIFIQSTFLDFTPLGYLYDRDPGSIAYLRCSFPDPVPSENPVKLAPAINNASQPVCYENRVAVDWNGSPIYLSSQGKNLTPLAIDDVLEITVNHPDGTVSGPITWVSMTSNFGPLDLSQYFIEGINNVTVRILDAQQPKCGGSEVWLIWDSGMFPIFDYTIRESVPSAQLRHQFYVAPWMRWIMSTLRKGSNAAISLVGPDGTVYDSTHPLVEYVDTSKYAVLTLNLESPQPGTWEVVVDVISASPESVFFLNIVGKQNNISATDSLPPISNIQLDGISGMNGWFLSDVTVSLTAEDNPGGSGVRLIEWSIDSGSTWHEYHEPFTLNEEGVFHLIARAIDGAGNTEVLPARADVRIDWTPPVTTGTVTGSRDMLGIFRSEVTNELTATDNLSGVKATYFSLDGGANWTPYSGVFTLADNATYNYLFRSIDEAGNQEQAKLSDLIDIQRFVVLADTHLAANRATTIESRGVFHSNDDVALTDNTTVMVDRLHYIDQFTQSGNVSLTINQLLKVTNRFQIPLYPLRFYRERCTIMQSPVTISDTSPVYDKCIYVTGDVTIRTTTARGKLTIVSEGVIYDQSTNSELQAWDTANGILFLARRGYVTSSTGAKYTGIIYAPFSRVEGQFTNFTLNGGLFAKTISLGSGTTLNTIQIAGFPVSTYTLPLTTPTQPKPTVIYTSSTNGGTVGGVVFADEDILADNLDSDAWSMHFDGSDIGLGGTDIDAFALMPDGNLLLSIDTDFNVPGFGLVDDSDIIRFIPTSLGNNTAGRLEWYFDGSDVGLTTTSEDIDSIGFAPDGRILISTLDSFSVTDVSGNDEDLIAFSPSQLGTNTVGTWSFYFDGSDVGLNESANEDINGVWVDAKTGKLYLTTVGSFSVPGIIGDGSDIFICIPGSLGATTTCSYLPFWDGSSNGFSGQDTDGLSISP